MHISPVGLHRRLGTEHKWVTKFKNRSLMLANLKNRKAEKLNKDSETWS